MLSGIVADSDMFPLVLLSLALLCRFLCTGRPAGASVASPAFVVPAGAVAAEVVGVTDGDTFTARMDGKAVKIRIHGIDAPGPDGGRGLDNPAGSVWGLPWWKMGRLGTS